MRASFIWNKKRITISDGENVQCEDPETAGIFEGWMAIEAGPGSAVDRLLEKVRPYIDELTVEEL